MVEDRLRGEHFLSIGPDGLTQQDDGLPSGSSCNNAAGTIRGICEAITLDHGVANVNETTTECGRDTVIREDMPTIHSMLKISKDNMITSFTNNRRGWHGTGHGFCDLFYFIRMYE